MPVHRVITVPARRTIGDLTDERSTNAMPTTTTTTTTIDAATDVLNHVAYILPIYRASARVRQIGFVRRHVAALDFEIANLGQVPFTLIELKGAINTFDSKRSPEHWDALRDQTQTLHAQVQMYLDKLVKVPLEAKPAEPEAEVEEDEGGGRRGGALQPSLPVAAPPDQAIARRVDRDVASGRVENPERLACQKDAYGQPSTKPS